jgi:hypothetical protein
VLAVKNLDTAQAALKAAERQLCPPALVALVKELAEEHHPDAVIVQGVFLTECFSVLLAETLKLIDTTDMFARRETNVRSHGIPEPITYSAQEERSRLLRADVIIAIQMLEASFFRQLVPERQVICIGVDFAGEATANNPEQERDVIAVIGSDNAADIHGCTIS